MPLYGKESDVANRRTLLDEKKVRILLDDSYGKTEVLELDEENEVITYQTIKNVS
jgi:hypothetical protein